MEKPKCQKTAERAKKYREMHKARRRKLEAFVAYILKFQGIEVLQNFEIYVEDNGDDPDLSVARRSRGSGRYLGF